MFIKLNNLKTKTAMHAKILVLVICIEAIIYLLLHLLLNGCLLKVLAKSVVLFEGGDN